MRLIKKIFDPDCKSIKLIIENYLPSTSFKELKKFFQKCLIHELAWEMGPETGQTININFSFEMSEFKVKS